MIEAGVGKEDGHEGDDENECEGDNWGGGTGDGVRCSQTGLRQRSSTYTCAAVRISSGICSACCMKRLTRETASESPGVCAACIREERWMMLLLGSKSRSRSKPIECNCKALLVMDSSS